MSRGPQGEGRAVARPGRGARAGVRIAMAAITCLLLAAPAAATAQTPSSGPAGSVATAKAKKKSKAMKLRVAVSVLDTTQRGVAKARKVKVKVTASGKASTTVRVKIGRTTITKTAKLTFKKKGSRTVSLSLSSAGLTKVKRCGAPKVVVEVTYGKKRATKTRTLSKSSAFCKTTPVVPPVDPPVVPPTEAPRPTGNCTAVDPLDDSTCLLPWPNDYYTRADPTSQTGRRLALRADQLPQNNAGKILDGTPYNRNDGFSANSAILTKVPGLYSKQGLDASGVAQIGDIGRSMDADSPIVVINATTGARTPIWSEIDMSNQGAAANPAKRLLITRAAKVLDEGQRYIVAIRDLKTAEGTPIPAGAAFRQFRDSAVPAEASDETKARQAHMDEIFSRLQGAGIDRSSLYLAWDFTTGSQDSLSGPALKMRDEAFAQLGDTDLADTTVQGDAPTFTVTKDYDPYSHSESHYVLKRVDGTMKVPCFMGHIDFNGSEAGYCGPGTTINWGPDNKPVQARDGNGVPQTFDAPVTCIIPRAAKDSDEMATDKQAITFGHGLLGDATTLTSVKDRAGVDKAVICGTDWIGMAKGDIPTVLQALTNMSNFPAIAERSVQSLLNFMYLGRWMISQDTDPAHPGLNATPAFKPTSGVLVDPSQRLYNLGGSQGGIMGGALTALSPDFDRSVLDVPAVGYTTLLNRSAAGAIFAPTLAAGYKEPPVQQVMLSLAQTIWDRGEGGGYVHHVTTDALPGTPPHKVIILEAFGDHLVSNIQTETEARTVGAVLRTPALDPNRSLDKVPYYGLAIEPATSFAGPGGFDAPAVLIPIDIGPKRVEGGANRGVDPEPQANIWPTDGFGPGGNGTDPHADVATSNLVLTLLRDFLKPSGGVITDQPSDPSTGLGGCGLKPCYAEGWTGPTP